MSELPYRLDRTVVIQARPETVFSFFTNSDRWAAWWGSGSTIDARPGGRLLIRHPGGVESSGEVLEVLAPDRIVFTYGFNSGKPIPPGSSTVTIRLEPLDAGTRLHLSHEFADAGVRDEHVQGWRYQLSVFGNVVADTVNANGAGLVDAWFEAWNEKAPDTRERTLTQIAAKDVRFRDRFSLIDGTADLVPHIGAAQRFMPEMRIARRGDVRHCQGTLLVDWVALAADGSERGSGTNVFTLGPDGRIQSVTGFWAPPKATSQQPS
jgi:uncharacterized protein YndB with AHSA1/START domain